MNLKYVALTITLGFAMSGCANNPMPNFYNGKYYMAGDDNCKFMRQIEPDKVMCQNSSHRDTGYRIAMTDQQLQMYMHQQSLDQANAAMTAAIISSSGNHSHPAPSQPPPTFEPVWKP